MLLVVSEISVQWLASSQGEFSRTWS